MIINLGCGNKKYIEAVNVDICGSPDMKVDLSLFPWPWEDNSIDGIFASHIIEHFASQECFILECHRILKPGGFLRIAAPHSSCVTSIGHIGHYRTYCYGAFHDYLTKPNYIFKEPLFKTTEQRLNWWYEFPDGEGKLSKPMLPIIKLVDKIMNSIININPRVFENTLSGLIQCREVIWRGEKICQE